MDIRSGVAFALLLAGILSGERPLQVGCTAILAMYVLVAAFPRSPLSKALFSQHAPSLDVSSMTRRACWHSAAGFLVIAAASLATIYGVTLFEPWLGRDPWDVPTLAALLFMYSIAFLMGLVGSLYLAFRAPFRPKAFPPESEISDGA